MLFKPSQRLSLTLSADYFEDNFGTQYYGTPVVSAAVAREPSSAVSGSAGLLLDRAMRRVNFNFTDEQNAIRDMARSFAEQEMAPHAKEWDEKQNKDTNSFTKKYKPVVSHDPHNMFFGPSVSECFFVCRCLHVR